MVDPVGVTELSILLHQLVDDQILISLFLIVCTIVCKLLLASSLPCFLIIFLCAFVSGVT